MLLFKKTLALLLATQACARLLGIPTVPFDETAKSASFSLKQLSSIVVDVEYQHSTDTKGETLIPPTLLDFASTFGDDLSPVLGFQIPITTAKTSTTKSIYLTLGEPGDYLDVAGRPTSEGYTIKVTIDGITITGASPLGVWWGTRSILQQAVLQNLDFSTGSGVDAPGWSTRGIMLDCGRHYYPPEFLIEMCSYLSFFKQNTFHLHLDDNPNVNPNVSYERKLSAYAAFRLNSDNSGVSGLNKRLNESYTQADFELIQQRCASRGVTIIPEIESPGHALAITQWKPELALSTDFTLLNISHPDTIPTLKTIWATFLPWFTSKTVHIGADEYSSLKIADYNRYVNTMQQFVWDIASKNTRIWGTFPPSTTPHEINVYKNISIQHWASFEDNPYFDYVKNGYSVLNSDDAFYVVAKWSGSYPQKLNVTRVFQGAPDGGPFSPNIFDISNATNNPAKDNPFVLGHVMALWNDFGPNSTSVIEAYYALRDGLPALADKQWGGDLTLPEYDSIFDRLQLAVPGQNLDRRITTNQSIFGKSLVDLMQGLGRSLGFPIPFSPPPVNQGHIFSYDFSKTKSRTAFDASGNGFDGTLSPKCKKSGSSLILGSDCSVSTPLTTKGRNYTLSFYIKPTSIKPGTLFSGSQSSLVAGNGSLSEVMLITNGIAYPVNYTLPLNTWTNINLVALGNATYLNATSSGASGVYEFTTTIGVYDNSFVWGNPMAIEAPIAVIGGDAFEGEIKDIVLKDGADARYADHKTPLVIGVAPYK